MNWWVEKVSDPVHWDVEGLSILDPKQLHHVLDLMDVLRDYGLQGELVEAAFIPFVIEAEAPKGAIQLAVSQDSLIESDEKLFALADQLDEDKSPYADLLKHLIRLRVKFLNDTIDFDQPLGFEEVDEHIAELRNTKLMSATPFHIFDELCEVLEFVPEGYEAEDTVGRVVKPDEEISFLDEVEEVPDVEEEELQDLEKRELMRWSDDDRDSDDADVQDDELGLDEEAQPPKRRRGRQASRKV